MKIRVFILVLVVSCLYSCSYNQEITQTLEDQTGVPTENFNEILFIPYGGCSNCVLKALKYLGRTSKQKERLTVYFLFESEKQVRLRMRSLEIKEENILFIKEKQRLLKVGVSHFYPTILKKDSINKWKVHIADPSSDILDEPL